VQSANRPGSRSSLPHTIFHLDKKFLSQNEKYHNLLLFEQIQRNKKLT
jgi:hypothetical protein